MDPVTLNAILRLVPSLAGGIAQFIGLAKAEGSISDEQIAQIELDLNETHGELLDAIEQAKLRIAAGDGT